MQFDELSNAVELYLEYGWPYGADSSYPYSEALVGASADAQTQYVPVISGLPADVMESIAAVVAQPSTTFNRLHDVAGGDDGEGVRYILLESQPVSYRRFANQALSEYLPLAESSTEDHPGAPPGQWEGWCVNRLWMELREARKVRLLWESPTTSDSEELIVMPTPPQHHPDRDGRDARGRLPLTPQRGPRRW